MVDAFVVFAMHCLADFPMQGEYLARTKSKSFYVLLCHCAIYTLIMTIGFRMVADIRELGPGIDWDFVIMLLFYSHLIVDFIKGHFEAKLPLEKEDEDKRIWKRRMMLLYFDQATHLVVAYAILEACIRQF